jgi:hypothetical protein
MALKDFLFGNPTPGSNDPEISQFLANQRAATSVQEGAGEAAQYATVAAILEQATYGARADGTSKGMGYFGELATSDGGIATEYSEGTQINGKEIQIPMLVPTLTQEELNYMLHNVIPANDRTPDHIFRKALAHAKHRLSQGLSPFATIEDQLMNGWEEGF